MKVVYVTYHDHNSERLNVDEKPTGVINDEIGFLVYEDAEAITLRHGRGDIGGLDEDWEVVTIRKADIIEHVEFSRLQPELNANGLPL